LFDGGNLGRALKKAGGRKRYETEDCAAGTWFHNKLTNEGEE